jgi:predicted peptidase
MILFTDGSGIRKNSVDFPVGLHRNSCEFRYDNPVRNSKGMSVGFCSVALILLHVLAAGAAGGEPAWKEASGQVGDAGLRYLVWTPGATPPPAGGWPLVVWLRGFALDGGDLLKLKSNGLPAVIEKVRPEFVLVAPQLSSMQLWWDQAQLDDLLTHMRQRHRVDPSRLYLTGMSLGASTAYDWAARSPSRFAGLLLLAGAIPPDKAKSLVSTPAWAFHGADDRVVALRKARAMEQAIRDAGGTVKFTELPGVGHDVDRLTQAAFVESRAIEWLLTLRRANVQAGAPAGEPAWKEASGQVGDAGLRYLAWTPAATPQPVAGWPLVVWLHGFSLRGEDLTKLKTYGPPAVIDKLRPEFVLVAPQLASKQLWWDKTQLDELLAHARQWHRIDASRLYLAGASLGAGTAYDWAARSPDRFAGLLLLAGTGDPDKAKSVVSTRVWAFHGADDRVVPLRKARAMEQAIRDAGGTVKFTELSGVGHDADRLTQAAFIEHRAIAWLLTLHRANVQAGTRAGEPASSAGGPEVIRDKVVEEIRRQAATLKPTLPVFRDPVPIPSNDTIFEWIKGLCSTPHRRPGTAEGHQAEAWVARQFQALGLENVTSDRVPIKVWQAQKWGLQVAGKPAECFFLLNSGFTGARGVTAPLLWADDGQFGDLRPSEAKGKIVVARAKLTYHDDAKISPRSYFHLVPRDQSWTVISHAAFPSNLLGGFLPIKITDAYERAKNAGAAGFLMVTGDLRSQGSSLYWPYDAEVKSLPGLYVSQRDSAAVEAAAKAGRTATLVQTGEVTDGYMANVWGVLPGASDDAVLITSHHDGPHQGAVEDASGIAQVLAQAWAWSRVPREKRPRTLVFVAAAGHFYKGRGAYEFAKAHPEMLNRCRAVLTLEHLPCKEVRRAADGDYECTGRTQPVTIYMPQNPALVAAVWKGLEKKPPPMVVSAERPLLGGPLSDAAGYFQRSTERSSGYPHRAGVPYVSWISAPLYLIDAADAPDKIEQSQLAESAATITDVVKQLMLAF